MDLVTGAMGNLAPKLLQLLQDEYKLQKGVRKQVQFLSRELDSIHAALRKVAQVPWDQLDEQVKLWAREVREASYDMEDVIDTFLVRVDGHDPADPSRLKRTMKNMAKLFSKGKARRDIAGVIEDIKKTLEEVAERRARYKVDEIIVAKPAATSTIDPRLAAMYNEVTQLIGIDKSRDELISMLSCQPGGDAHEKEEMKRVSVVGGGGLGKTTLAKAVYDKLKGDFSCAAFVPVGRNPDLKKVLKDILIDLDNQHYMSNVNMAELDERQLIDKIRGFLEQKRYFVVIDDIWEPQSWETIKLAFVKNNGGCRIITTTRKVEVAKEAGEIYKLQPLSYDKSKKLLYTRIFGGEDRCPDNRPDGVLDKILNKCDGVPLAIITMASLLVGKPREEWSEVYSSIGFGHKDNRHVENTMRILSFSYYDLPSHLRTCLLYLSVYPEDYVIQKSSLIWKWVAEGFVHEKQGKSLFEVGEGYFNDLINRSMIQVVETELIGVVKACCVHDMVLDLIRTLSREENFVAIIDNVEGTISQSSNIRRLACHNITVEHIIAKADHMDMPKVRSYIACNINQWVPFSSFKLLRVLAIQSCQSTDDLSLESLGNLHHLRYLGLKGTNIRELPKQIGDLKFLQVLDLEGTAIEKLPSSVVLLSQLVCLRATIWTTRAPDAIGKLTFLQELRIYIGTDDMCMKRFMKELGSLRELRELQATIGMMDESIQIELVESLCSLPKIQHLSLLSLTDIMDADTTTWEAAGFVLPRCLRHFVLTCIRFSRLPSCINPSHLPKLSLLALHVVTIDDQDLKVLGSLTELRYLSLRTQSAATLSNINAIDGCFQKLRCFILLDATAQFQCNEEDSGISLHISDGSDAMPSGSRKNDDRNVPSAVMPNLEVLVTYVFVRALKDGNCDCEIMGLEYLTSLQKVMVYIHCDNASTAEVKEVEAALRKVAEVHPNRPTLIMQRLKKGRVIPNDQELDADTVPKDEEHQEEKGNEVSLTDVADVAKLNLASS